MKKPIKKTNDGKRILNLRFCREGNVWIGAIEIKPGQFRAAMWNQSGEHIQKANSNLNLSL